MQVNSPLIGMVDESVYLCDPPAPGACEIMSQRFRFTQSGEWTQVDVHDQALNTFKSFVIGSLPVEVVVMDPARTEHMVRELKTGRPYGGSPALA